MPRMHWHDLLARALPRASFRRDVAQTALTNVAILVCGTLSGILAARLLGPSGRGELAAIQAFPALFAGLTNVGLFEAVIYYSRGDPGKASRYAVSSAVLAALLSLLLISLGSLVAPYVLRSYPPGVIRAAQLYLGVLLAHILLGVLVYRLRATQDVAPWNFLRLLPPLSWLLLVAGFWRLNLAAPRLLALFYLASLFLLGIALLFAYRHRLNLRFQLHVSDWPFLFRYALPLSLAAAPERLEQRLDQIFVAALLPPQDLGHYAVALSWSGLLRLPATAVTATAFPRLASLEDPDSRRTLFRRAAGALLILTLAGAAFLALTARWLLPLAFGQAFERSIRPALILLFSQGLRNMALMVETQLKAEGKPSVVLYSRWSALIALVASAPILIPYFLVDGAAMTVTLASFTGLAIATWRLGRLKRHSLRP